MKYTTERKPGSIVEINITAEDADFQQAVDQAITRQAKNVQIPGFRKGKAPRHMVERFYGGREVFKQDAAERLMDTYYREALEGEDLRVVGDPELVSMELDPTLTFVVAVPVYPEVKLGDYTAVREEPVDAALTDEDVDLVITRLLRQQAEWEDVTEAREPVEGEQVVIDYTVHEGDEQFQEPIEDAEWVLGETNLLPALRDRIESMKLGDTEEFEVFFEEDDETADPQIRGKQLKYTVTLKGLRTKQLGEVNDEFAQKAAGIETVDDLKEAIRHDVHKGKTDDARNQVLNKIIESIGADAEIELPAPMIDEEVEHQLSHRKEDLKRQGMDWDMMLAMSGLDEEKVKEDTRPEAERRLRNTMILQEVAKLENVEVTDEDLEAEIDRLVGPDLNPDENDTEAVERAKRMRDVYASDYFKNVLRNDLFEKKLTDRLIEIATEGKGAVLNAYEEPETPFEPKRWSPPTPEVDETDAAEGSEKGAPTTVGGLDEGDITSDAPESVVDGDAMVSELPLASSDVEPQDVEDTTEIPTANESVVSYGSEGASEEVKAADATETADTTEEGGLVEGDVTPDAPETVVDGDAMESELPLATDDVEPLEVEDTTEVPVAVRSTDVEPEPIPSSDVEQVLEADLIPQVYNQETAEIEDEENFAYLDDVDPGVESVGVRERADEEMIIVEGPSDSSTLLSNAVDTQIEEVDEQTAEQAAESFALDAAANDEMIVVGGPADDATLLSDATDMMTPDAETETETAEEAAQAFQQDVPVGETFAAPAKDATSETQAPEVTWAESEDETAAPKAEEKADEKTSKAGETVETNTSKSTKLPNIGEGTDWVAGTGSADDIPEGFPIKGNANSKIYHTPESPAYGITIAEIYFATEEAADTHGYRKPKNMQ